MFKRKTKYHAVLRKTGETWCVETLELFGADVNKLESQIKFTLNDLETKIPNIIFHRYNALHRPLRENESRSQRILEEIKTNKR